MNTIKKATISIICWAITVSPVLALTPGSNPGCQAWRQGDPVELEIGQYCRGEDMQTERIYELELIVEAQRDRIDHFSEQIGMMNRSSQAAQQLAQPAGQVMGPELYELMAAFEARVAKLEKAMDIVNSFIVKAKQLLGWKW